MHDTSQRIIGDNGKENGNPYGIGLYWDYIGGYVGKLVLLRACRWFARDEGLRRQPCYSHACGIRFVA